MRMHGSIKGCGQMLDCAIICVVVYLSAQNCTDCSWSVKLEHSMMFLTSPKMLDSNLACEPSDNVRIVSHLYPKCA